VTLELNKLTGQVNEMGAAMAKRQTDHRSHVDDARAALNENAEVTEALRAKIRQAREEDSSWRGAEPLGDRLDERHTPSPPEKPATLIASDGSQIYPDRHGIATYFLVNTGSIVLRQASGDAPVVESIPEIFFQDKDIYDRAGRPHDSEHVNGQRDRREIETLANLAEKERGALGGDLGRPIITMMDGPLLLWTPQRSSEREVSREVRFFTDQLDRLRQAHAPAVGYVDRPGSANVLRTLELCTLTPEGITRDTLRTGPFRAITDRLLFADLQPNQRTGLFASTTELNDRYQSAGHRIIFFYMNVAQTSEAEHSVIVRVEVPEWVAADPAKLDSVQNALYADSKLTGFPYGLARAHELAVVTRAEQGQFEEMLQQAMWRHGVPPLVSGKTLNKRWMGGG
jgi:hypothetical protein